MGTALSWQIELKPSQNFPEQTLTQKHYSQTESMELPEPHMGLDSGLRSMTHLAICTAHPRPALSTARGLVSGSGELPKLKQAKSIRRLGSEETIQQHFMTLLVTVSDGDVARFIPTHSSLVALTMNEGVPPYGGKQVQVMDPEPKQYK